MRRRPYRRGRGLASRRLLKLGHLQFTDGGNATFATAESSGDVPISADNKAIKSGLAAEQNATLKIYNWVEYINQAVVNSFAKKYTCKVEVSTFNTMDEALAKIQREVQFDVFMGVTIDVLGPLIQQNFVEPINHSYIPDMNQAWPNFQNPSTTVTGSTRLRTPSTPPASPGVKTRSTRGPVHHGQPLGDAVAGEEQGKVAILDDYREGISLGLMKNGLFGHPRAPANCRSTGRRPACASRWKPGRGADAVARSKRSSTWKMSPLMSVRARSGSADDVAVEDQLEVRAARCSSLTIRSA